MADPEITILGLGAFALGPTALGGWGFEEVAAPEEQQGARVLDPGTGDYLTDGGVIQRVSTARQRIIIAVATRFGTSMATRGVQLPEVHDATTARITEQEVLAAIRPMLDDGSITDVQISIVLAEQNIPGRLGINVNYFDTLAGKNDLVEA